MPMLIIKTNLPDQQIPDSFNLKATKLISELLSKPVQSVTVIIDTNSRMSIGGTNAPGALVEFRSIANLKGPNGKVVVEALTKLIHEELTLPTDRFFITLFELEPELVAFNGQLRSEALKR